MACTPSGRSGLPLSHPETTEAKYVWLGIAVNQVSEDVQKTRQEFSGLATIGNDPTEWLYSLSQLACRPSVFQGFDLIERAGFRFADRNSVRW
jgi:hypothetical protein